MNEAWESTMRGHSHQLSESRNSPALRRELTATIWQMARTVEPITTVYGLGSFFRGEPFADVDLLIVVSHDRGSLLATGTTIRAAFQPLGDIVGAPVDLTIHTEAEHAQRTLRDIDSLMLLYVRGGLQSFIVPT